MALEVAPNGMLVAAALMTQRCCAGNSTEQNLEVQVAGPIYLHGWPLRVPACNGDGQLAALHLGSNVICEGV